MANPPKKTGAQLDREVAEFLQSKSWSRMDLGAIEEHVSERRSRDPGAWSSRDDLVAVARTAAASVFSSRKPPLSDAVVRKAREAALDAIRRRDPLAGTADHPSAAYSHGIFELADEGVDQAARAWTGAQGARGRAQPTSRRKSEDVDHLFIGTYPTGLSYADRSRERNGDYLRVAFLPYETLEIEWARGVRVSPEMRRLITEDAARLAARRGEIYATSSSGNHTVKLGG